ncbi:farnesol dehydrogenase-like [Drosophila bipectinata]|uniref:farnesol dehydrogenase-like n=1 Tax=Drosophila bipectinata TaxID=42026 RepID=UPI001C8A2AF5|nr:farnesol dehydrogenase-like [Drosophila bipectinata]
MDRWTNRVAVVTGASSGIGAACCKDLVSKGMVVVGLARRENRLQELKESLPADQAKRFHFRKCDVGEEQDVIDAFKWIDTNLGGADVLVNNAGIVRLNVGVTNEGNSKDLRDILNTNVLGVSWCTREAFRSLQERKVDDGHILIINSVAGHKIPVSPFFSLGMYPPSKHAVTALTEILRQEFLNKKTKTKITSISPGGVDTEIFDKTIAAQLPEVMPMLRSEDVADAVTYCIQTPPNVQIHELIIKPVGEML